MTIINKKELEKEKKSFNENLYFHLDQDIIKNKNDIKRLKEILENEESDEETKASFRSADDFYRKLSENNFTISLEEISGKSKP